MSRNEARVTEPDEMPPDEDNSVLAATDGDALAPTEPKVEEDE